MHNVIYAFKPHYHIYLHINLLKCLIMVAAFSVSLCCR